MNKRILELRFYNYVYYNNPDSVQHFTQKQIELLLNKPLSDSLYEYRNNEETIIGRIINTKFI
jgi:hypothetical protein